MADETSYGVAGRVEEIADKILDTSISTLHSLEIPVPEQAYLAMGSEEMIAHDNCSQLTVSLATSRHGLPNRDTPTAMRVNQCNKGYIVDFVVQIVRCTPTPNQSTTNSVRRQALTPQTSFAALDESARKQMNDVWALHKVAQSINSFDTNLGRDLDYSVVVGPDEGGVQPISLIIAVNV